MQVRFALRAGMVALLLLFCCTAHGQAAESYVLGYYPAGMRDRLPAEQVDFKTLTHLCHAFIRPNRDGTLDFSDRFLYPELVRAAHAADRKILVSVGGGGGGKAVDGFAPVAADPELRGKFIANLIRFCDENGYDGIDFDWEYPRGPVERANHAILVTELRAEITRQNKPLLITMAASGRLRSDETFDHSILKEQLDWFNIMTYDFHGLWSRVAGFNSPVYSVIPGSKGVPEGAATAVDFMVRQMGIPPQKLLLGLPFYGFVLEAERILGPSTGGHYINYSEIVMNWAAGGWRYHWNDLAMVPYLTREQPGQVITFDTPESTGIKCDFARVSGLRGVMIWALGQDVLEGRQLLLETVSEKKWDYR